MPKRYALQLGIVEVDETGATLVPMRRWQTSSWATTDTDSVSTAFDRIGENINSHFVTELFVVGTNGPISYRVPFGQDYDPDNIERNKQW